MLTCEDLTVQYQSKPIGLDIKQPHFSWILRSEEKNVMQATYCLTVTDETGTAVWNSGVVQSDSSCWCRMAASRCRSKRAIR